MGLTIHWTLSTAQKLSDDAVLTLVTRTAEFARKLGCENVGTPERGGPEEIKLRKLPNGDSSGDFFAPTAGWSVAVLPGDGCEAAVFGLCQYPGGAPWKLSTACKTQYAARHGWEHFLACHRRVISLLDFWRDLGAAVKVADEGGFWETRSVEHLQAKLGTYDRLVAAMAGALVDDLGKGPKGAQAEIFNDARFERLEAEGRAEFAEKIEEARKLFRDSTSS